MLFNLLCLNTDCKVTLIYMYIVYCSTLLHYVYSIQQHNKNLLKAL